MFQSFTSFSSDGMSESDTSKDESASPHVTSPPSILSPSRPGTTMSHSVGVGASHGRGAGIQSEAILEVPELEENLPCSSNVGKGEDIEQSGGSTLFSPGSGGSTSSPTATGAGDPGRQTRRSPHRKSRAMSSAQLNLQHFLDSTANAARRSSLAIRPLLTEMKREEVNPHTPQFLTVSASFSARDRSRSPSPFPPVPGEGHLSYLSSIQPDHQRLDPSPNRAGECTSPSGIRSPRYSLDVKSLPSYLARKRSSITFGAKILSNLVEGKKTHIYKFHHHLFLPFLLFFSFPSYSSFSPIFTLLSLSKSNRFIHPFRSLSPYYV